MYLEKQTEFNYLCLYIKKYARIKKTWKNKRALGVVQNYQCKKLKITFGSHFFTYLPILANFNSKCLSWWVASGCFYKLEFLGKCTQIWIKNRVILTLWCPTFFRLFWPQNIYSLFQILILNKTKLFWFFFQISIKI